MSLRIVEFFGYAPADASPKALVARRDQACPFVGGRCSKILARDRVPSGVCTVRLAHSGPVIICPNRLYNGDYLPLHDVVREAFDGALQLLRPDQIEAATGPCVAVFGRGWGKELKLPGTRGRGRYSVDFILAVVDSGRLQEFVAVEVQSMDTTGNYRAERQAYLRGDRFDGYSDAGINWENVSKRILPQIIYKGNVLRRERLCRRGLFFVCPEPVHERIQDRLGGGLETYDNLQTGSLTFRWYNVGPSAADGQRRSLEPRGELRTVVEQVAQRFVLPGDLPPPNVFEGLIEAEFRGDG